MSTAAPTAMVKNIIAATVHLATLTLFLSIEVLIYPALALHVVTAVLVVALLFSPSSSLC